MLKPRPAKEVIITLQNDVGALNQIAKIIAEKGINVLAASSWVNHDQAIIHLVPDDTQRTLDALRAHGYAVREADVVITEAAHKPGMLRHVTERLAQEGIDIHHLYASATPQQDTCLLVFATAHNDHALMRLRA
jgi:hypothetical protein